MRTANDAGRISRDDTCPPHNSPGTIRWMLDRLQARIPRMALPASFTPSGQRLAGVIPATSLEIPVRDKFRKPGRCIMDFTPQRSPAADRRAPPSNGIA